MLEIKKNGSKTFVKTIEFILIEFILIDPGEKRL